ncbi:hypothetical protein PoB_006113200 [Plakobranchus ocellatus]|uniref:Uncharacterized protein n=1 Tax=Plakobranchus ocellatus TaxID=259542 RepID=A0AAV4CRW4_9GAST|nr:hypothetical protein PoB_006113200 [Plakobranchus ocellatus]
MPDARHHGNAGPGRPCRQFKMAATHLDRSLWVAQDTVSYSPGLPSGRREMKSTVCQSTRSCGNGTRVLPHLAMHYYGKVL